jgi:hypothetical protein
VLLHEFVLIDLAENVSARDRVAFLERKRLELPHLRLVKAGDVDTTGYEEVLRQLSNGLKGTLDTIENVFHNAGAELYGQRLLLTEHGVTDSEPGGVLVDLDGRGVAFELNDLSYKLLVAYAHQLVHSSTGHVVGNNN